MRKTITAFAVSALMLLGSVFGLTACSSVDPHEHKWNDGEITTQPTCTEEGVKTYKCTVNGCNETMTETVSKAEHEYDAGKITQDPTCKEDGVKTYTCGGCGHTYTEGVGKTAHTWDSGTLSVIPTLNSAGETKYNCTVCGATSTEPVAAREDFGERFYTSLPTDCFWMYGYTENADNFAFVRITGTDEQTPAVWKAEGVEISANAITSAGNAVIAYAVPYDLDLNFTVAFTGEEEQTRLGATLIITDKDNTVKGERVTVNGDGKDWSFITEEPISVTEGDCLYLMFTNNGAGKPAGGLKFTLTTECIHIWNDGEVTAEPTCSMDGVKTFTCEKCRETYTEAVTERPEHNFTGDWLVGTDGHFRKCGNCNATETPVRHVYDREDADRRIPATCHSDGTKYMVCECGDEITEAITERPAHDFTGAWLIGEGGHYHKCENCEAVEDTVPHVHNRENEDKRIPAKCDSDGTRYMVCECGDEVTEAITERPEHEFTGEWINTSAEGHYRKCKNCGENEAPVKHTMVDTDKVLKPATDEEDGLMETECSVCQYKGNRVIPSLKHIQGTEYGYEPDGDTHWFICSEHPDCGVKFEVEEHDFNEEIESKPATCQEDGYKITQCECGAQKTVIISKDTVEHSYGDYISDGESGHHRVCGVCSSVTETEEHDLRTEFIGTGHGVERTYCTLCGEEKTRSFTADYKEQFNTENSGWKYGYTTDYDFGNNAFTFTAGEFAGDVFVKPKDEGQENYSLELKADWINVSDGMAVIGYTFATAETVTADLSFTGESGMRISVRYVLVSDEAVKDYAGFFGENESINANRVFSVSAGDVLYAVITKEEGSPKGSFGYKIITHILGEWKADDEKGTHYKECSMCGKRFHEGEHYSENPASYVKPDLYTNGELIYDCDICGKHVEITLPARADFKDDFTIENQDGAWSYGKMDDPWSGDRHFVQATEKRNDEETGDKAWIANGGGVEIKAGWINSSSEPVIAYTAANAVNANIKVDFTGSKEDTVLAIRIWVIENGVLTEKLFTKTKDENGQKIVVNFEYAFKDGETVYIMFSNEGSPTPNGALDITITTVEAQQGN